MTEDEDEASESVSVSMELTGRYDDVLEKLATEAAEGRHLVPLTADVEAILDTIDRIDGGTRSAIADRLPDDMAAEYDAEGVVTVLQVLERYGLVRLEGNTWYPGDTVE